MHLMIGMFICKVNLLHMGFCSIFIPCLVKHLLCGTVFCYGCRGIDVVRNKIKMFAQKKVTLPPGRHKVVILDEADRLVLLSL